MSVVPMKLLTLAGPLERFDQVVSACVIDQQFHPEPALRLMGEVKGVMPMDSSNPYAPLLRRAEEVAREAGVELAYAPFPDRLPRKELTAYFDQVEEQVMTLLHRKEELEHTAAESAAAVEQLEYLRGIGADLDELWGLEFSRFRYGYLPRETYDSFQDALDQEDDLLFVPTTLGPRRVYGVYFTTKQAKSRVDMLFSSLHFTRINLEVQPHGTVEQAIAELNAGVERMKGEAAQAELDALYERWEQLSEEAEG